MQITGIYETHVEVSNLDRAILFYTETLGLKIGYQDLDRRIAFLWVGSNKDAMLGLWEKKEVHTRHFAFSCTVDFVRDKATTFLLNAKLQPYNFLKDGTPKPMVFSWMPALAIYFDDPDGNQLEFIAMLPGKGDPSGAVISYDEWAETNIAI